jgi:ferrous iron transport protein A
MNIRDPMDPIRVPPEAPSQPCNLAQLRKGDCATVTGMAAGHEHVGGLRLRLMELGFVPGEQVRVLAESFPGRDPMAIRVGNSTFALRRHEARWIEVRPRQP